MPVRTDAARPSQEDVFAIAQDGQVDEAVAVDVERVGAVDRRQVGRGIRDDREPEGAADGPDVLVERRRVQPARDVDVRLAVAIAVEDREAASDEESQGPVVRLGKPGARGLVNELRRARGGTGPRRAAEADGPCPRTNDYDCREHRPGDGRAAPGHPGGTWPA